MLTEGNVINRILGLSVTAVVITIVLMSGMHARQVDKQKAAPPGTLIDIGSHKLHLHCIGMGNPTVLFEAGAGDFSTRWSLVQEVVSKRVRACAYDRARSGWSEAGPQPRTMKQEVDELHTLLNRAEISGPYVLVGHSYGGLLVRLYTERYSKDVIGIVLVDPTHESTRLLVQRRGEPQGKWVRIREGANGLSVPDVQKTKTITPPEWQNYWAEELQQMHESRKSNPEPLGDRPLIVLAANKPSTRPAETPEDLWNDLQRERSDHKADLARLSRNSKLVRDPSSGHHIHVENPELVVRAIEEVIETAVRQTRLSGK
jgi:pimeloyl-ACP methyl ester carboxylesterase